MTALRLNREFYEEVRSAMAEPLDQIMIVDEFHYFTQPGVIAVSASHSWWALSRLQKLLEPRARIGTIRALALFLGYRP
jgi:hypothetical protein